MQRLPLLFTVMNWAPLWAWHSLGTSHWVGLNATSPEWMSGYIKVFEQQWECCLVYIKEWWWDHIYPPFSQLYIRPSATSYSDKSGTEGAADRLEFIFRSQFRAGPDTSMGKQITRIRLLQRPGPVKDGSRRSRQRWELVVHTYKHLLLWQ